MPRKIKSNKRRAALTDDNIKWLQDRGPSFTQFKDHDELVALWQAYGDETIAEWDMQENTRPVAIEQPKIPGSEVQPVKARLGVRNRVGPPLSPKRPRPVAE